MGACINCPGSTSWINHSKYLIPTFHNQPAPQRATALQQPTTELTAALKKKKNALKLPTTDLHPRRQLHAEDWRWCSWHEGAGVVACVRCAGVGGWASTSMTLSGWMGSRGVGGLHGRMERLPRGWASHGAGGTLGSHVCPCYETKSFKILSCNVLTVDMRTTSSATWWHGDSVRQHP